MSVIVESDQEAQARAHIQGLIARRFQRRRVLSWVSLSFVGLALLVALFPLYSILEQTVAIGGHYMRLSFFTQNELSPTVQHPNLVGGINNALVGTLIIVAVAVVLSVPLGIVGGIALFEFDNKFVATMRSALFSILAMPSILYGLFVLILAASFKLPFGAYLGSIALAILMIPMVAIVTFEGLGEVPRLHVEAGLALGAQRLSLMRRVMLPEARGRILPGALLAASRAIGETAPVLFVIGSNSYTSWNPFSQVESLPTVIYSDLASNYPAVRAECWAMGLVAMTIILIFNLAARSYFAWSSRELAG